MSPVEDEVAVVPESGLGVHVGRISLVLVAAGMAIVLGRTLLSSIMIGYFVRIAERSSGIE